MALSADDAYGLWIPKSTEKLLEQSETVFVGTVTLVKELEFERSNTFHIEENGVQRIEIENYTQTLDEYTVDIEEFLKSPQTSNTITMLEATVGGVPGRNVSIGGFEMGDRVLFFVPKIDGTNQYSPESFEIPKQCDAKSVLEQSRVFLFNDFKIMQDGFEKNNNFVANKPIEFVYNKDLDTLEGSGFDVDIKIRKIIDSDWKTALDEQIHAESKPCEWTATASWEFVPTGGRYSMQMHASEGNGNGGETVSGGFTVKEFDFPLKQYKSGISTREIQCNDSLVLVTKHDGSPACVTLETNKKLVERGWATCSDEIKYNRGHPCGVRSSPGISSDSLNLNIVGVEDGRISLYPANTCASLNLDRLTTQDIQRYKNDERGLNDTNILQVTSSDLKEIPNIGELIYAVHSIEFPYNKHSSVYLDGLTLVEYEFFLMEKSMKKYGDSKWDYFMQLDGDYEERLTNPSKQGLTNHFESPAIVYKDNVYSIDGTYFWTSDEHEPRRMGVYPQDAVKDDEKFIVLTDEDMKSVPKIKEAIENIDTVKESISARKGLPEDQWNQYREWFEQKSQDRLNSDEFRLIQHDGNLYSIGFGIC